MAQAGDHKRNIEIKAKLASEDEFNEKVEIAKKLTGVEKSEIIVQHDVFFKAETGRLKLRYENNTAKLVQYSRPNVAGVKLSKFNILEVSDGALMERMLDESIGTLGILDKTRHLFMFEGRTRIHLDIVKNNVSNFYGMEFEVMLRPDEDLEKGNEVAENLMKIFELKKDQLEEGSYFEILNN